MSRQHGRINSPAMPFSRPQSTRHLASVLLTVFTFLTFLTFGSLAGCGRSEPPAPANSGAAGDSATAPVSPAAGDAAPAQKRGPRGARRGEGGRQEGQGRRKPPTPAQATHRDLSAGDKAIVEAFRDKTSDIWVEAGGKVERLLPADNKGAKHQRFIVRLASGHTVLVSHNLDIALRVPVDVGSEVKFRGEYEWQKRGGVIHWTHTDPSGKRPGGWIEHNGKRYE
jgi:hypothetical protein